MPPNTQCFAHSKIHIGSNPPGSACQSIPLLEVRSRHLSHSHHRIHVAWDINLSSSEGPDSVATFPTAATDGESSVDAAQRDIYAPPAQKPLLWNGLSGLERPQKQYLRMNRTGSPSKSASLMLWTSDGREESAVQVLDMRLSGFKTCADKSGIFASKLCFWRVSEGSSVDVAKNL